MLFALDLTNPLKQYYDEGSNIQTYMSLLWVFWCIINDITHEMWKEYNCVPCYDITS